MAKTLYFFCGLFNALFAAFHLILAVGIQRTPGVDSGTRALLQALNVGSALMVLFLAAIFFICTEELTTRLGRLTILLGVLSYLTRALVEVMFSPQIRVFILAICLVVGLLHFLALRASLPEGQTA
jgi:hypothetical protein